MGLYDRRSMRDVPKTRPWAWILLGVIATLSAIALLTPVVRHGPQAAPTNHGPDRRHITRLRGPKTLAYGSRIMLTGHSSLTPGHVTVLGRWNNGPWRFIAIGQAGRHLYRLGIAVDHHGRLDLRVVQPNGDFSWGTYRVVDPAPVGAV